MLSLFFSLFLFQANCSDSFFDEKYVTHLKSNEVRYYIERPDYLTILILYDILEYKSILLGQALIPVFPKIKHLVKVYSVACEEDPDFCTDENKFELPVIQAYIPRGLSLMTEKEVVSEIVYKDKIHPDNLFDFIKSHLPYLGDYVSSDYLEEFLNLNGWKIIMFSKEDEVNEEFKAISSKFRGRLELGVVYINETKIIEKFEVYRFPSLICVNDDEVKRYEGLWIYDDLVKFLKDFARKEKIKSRPRRYLNEFFDSEQLALLPKFEIKKVGAEDIGQLVLRNNDLILVHVYDKYKSALWEKLHTEYKGIIEFVEINSEMNEELLKHLGAHKAPFIQLLPYKKNQRMQVNFKTLEDFNQQISLWLKPYVHILNDNSVNQFIKTLSTEQKLGLILVSQDPIPTSIKALGKVKSFSNFIKIGYLSSPKSQVLLQFSIKKYPSFFAFIQSSTGLRIVEYQGKLSDYSSLFYFIDSIAIPKLLKPLNNTIIDDEDLSSIKDLKTSSQFTKSCMSKTHICLIFNSNPLTLNTNHQSNWLHTMKKIQEVTVKRNFYIKVFKIDSNCHEEVKDSFKLSSNWTLFTLDSESQELAFDDRIEFKEILDFLFKVLRKQAEFLNFDLNLFKFHDKICENKPKNEL